MKPFWAAFACAVSVVSLASAQTPAPAPPAACPDANPLKNLYRGDLHAHTSFSLDAFTAGTRADPRLAYAFARGRGRIPIASGLAVSGPEAVIDRPLDFLAVTDHSEWLGVLEVCVLDTNNADYERPYCKAFRNQDSAGQLFTRGLAMLPLAQPTPKSAFICRGSEARRERCLAGTRSAWVREQEATAAAYDRCHFTTFKAYEWTGQDGRTNLHRNVIFSGDHVPATPFDFIHYPKPGDLWRALAANCKESEGCDVITIPHNSNASYAKMWNTIENAEDLPLMRRYQTLVEIFQHKGASECIPGDPMADAACDFEIVSGSFIMTMLTGRISKEPIGGAGYVRNALAQGLEYDALHQTNPLAMGIIAATDTHNATPGNVKEQGWPGHFGNTDNTPAIRLDKPRVFNPGGITGVWAEENSRESIFAALKRRETYGTSGPRIAARFYEVSGLADDAAARALCDDPSFPKRLLDAGAVPMGGVFKTAAKPYLFALAMKDETPLASIDIVKLSSDAAGHAKLDLKNFPLAGTDKNKACVFFRDTAFDPSRPTLYYARVLEDPSWRWSHYDCLADPKANPSLCDPAKSQAEGGMNIKIQERAWTSPVFSGR